MPVARTPARNPGFFALVESLSDSHANLQKLFVQNICPVPGLFIQAVKVNPGRP